MGRGQYLAFGVFVTAPQPRLTYIVSYFPSVHAHFVLATFLPADLLLDVRLMPHPLPSNAVSLQPLTQDHPVPKKLSPACDICCPRTLSACVLLQCILLLVFNLDF